MTGLSTTTFYCHYSANTTEDQVLTDWLTLARSQESDLFDLIEKLVLIETPTSDKAANDNISSLAAELLSSLGGEVTIHPEKNFGDNVTADWPGKDGNADRPHALVWTVARN